MNFKSIQNLFIIVFLVLNLLLLNIYRESKTKYDAMSNPVKSSIEYRLEKDNIKVGKLSDTHKNGNYLSAKKKDLIEAYKSTKTRTLTETSTHEIKATPLNTININQKITSDVIKDFFETNDLLYHADSYHYLDYLSTKDKKNAQLVFAQNYKGLPFLDDNSSTIFDFTASNNYYKLNEWTQNFLESIRPLREAQRLISEKEAIIALYNNSRITENAKIEWIELGYVKIIELDDEKVYAPTWLIKIQTNKTHKIEKVNAINSNITTETSIMKIDKNQ
jgi:regulatory protein YycI of two-component signal transduction system YycFG